MAGREEAVKLAGMKILAGEMDDTFVGIVCLSDHIQYVRSAWPLGHRRKLMNPEGTPHRKELASWFGEHVPVLSKGGAAFKELPDFLKTAFQDLHESIPPDVREVYLISDGEMPPEEMSALEAMDGIQLKMRVCK